MKESQRLVKHAERASERTDKMQHYNYAGPWVCDKVCPNMFINAVFQIMGEQKLNVIFVDVGYSCMTRMLVRVCVLVSDVPQTQQKQTNNIKIWYRLC